MNVGQLTGYLKDYDEEVEVHFGEAGESRTSTLDVTPLSRGEVGGSDESPWPTIGASVGLGTTAEAGLNPLIKYVKGIDRRLDHHERWYLIRTTCPELGPYPLPCSWFRDRASLGPRFPPQFHLFKTT